MGTLQELATWDRVIGVVGLLIGVWGAIVTLKGIERRVIAYELETVYLIGGPDAKFPKQVQVTFAGKNVPNLFRTTVFIWSAGNRAVRSEDFASEDLLHLWLGEENTILSIETIKATRTVNGFEVEPYPDMGLAKINFEFLDPGDGAVVELIHTGASIDVALRGTIKGHRSGIRHRPGHRIRTISSLVSNVLWVAVMSLFVLAVVWRTHWWASTAGLVIFLANLLVQTWAARTYPRALRLK